MPQNNFQKLLGQVRKQFINYSFISDTNFAWSAKTETITFNATALGAEYLLLHELGHAELAHDTYNLDIELLRLESAAWEHARKLANHFNIVLDDDYVQDNLDTYRDWLHARSQCPKCQQIGIQPKKNTYSCINCRYSWRVNDAKQCQLRRLRLQVQHQLE